MVSVLKIPRNHVLKCQKKFLSDLLSAGFLPNYEKKVWKPQISIDWLGFVWDLDKGIHSIPERKMLDILQLLNTFLENSKQPTARKVAAVVGKIIALSPALGNICRIMTRHLHHVINERTSWDSFVQIDDFFHKRITVLDNFFEVFTKLCTCTYSKVTREVGFY
jgi:hypothetical protein